MDKNVNYWPNCLEVAAAAAVFRAAAERYNDGDNSKDCVIKNALADVWSYARMYEHERQQGHGNTFLCGLCGFDAPHSDVCEVKQLEG